MSRAHEEIADLSRRLSAALAEAERTPDDGESRSYAARPAIELHAVLRLHFAQEEENFHVLADPEEEGGRSDRGRVGPKPSNSTGCTETRHGW